MIRMKMLATLLAGIILSSSMVAAQVAPTAGRSLATVERLTVRTPDGTRFPLATLIEPGKPTLIAFWASWCMPCLAEAPHLASLRRQFGGKYTFLYINRSDGDPDARQPQPAIDLFLARTHLVSSDYFVADTATYRRIVGADMATLPDGIVGIPRVYLFDRHGRQVYTALGYSEARSTELEARLKDAIDAR